MERAFAQAGLDLRIAMELERWHVIKEFVALNQGIALVPGFSVAEDSARLAVRPVSSGLPSLTYGIVTRKGRHLPAPVRNLIEAIRVRSGMLRFEAQFPFRHR
jgi:DNA-binding transcriptional LysR family regulator